MVTECCWPPCFIQAVLGSGAQMSVPGACRVDEELDHQTFFHLLPAPLAGTGEIKWSMNTKNSLEGKRWSQQGGRQPESYVAEKVDKWDVWFWPPLSWRADGQLQCPNHCPHPQVAQSMVRFEVSSSPPAPGPGPSLSHGSNLRFSSKGSSQWLSGSKSSLWK